MSRILPHNASYNSAQKLPSSSLFPKMKIVWFECDIWSLTQKEDYMLRVFKAQGPERIL
jgi:hypothetical protein